MITLLNLLENYCHSCDDAMMCTFEIAKHAFNLCLFCDILLASTLIYMVVFMYGVFCAAELFLNVYIG